MTDRDVKPAPVDAEQRAQQRERALAAVGVLMETSEVVLREVLLLRPDLRRRLARVAARHLLDAPAEVIGR